MGVWGGRDQQCGRPLLTALSLGPAVRRLHPGTRPADPVPAPGLGPPLVVLAALLHRGKCVRLLPPYLRPLPLKAKGDDTRLTGP